MTPASNLVRVETRDDVAVVVLDRPSQRNALSIAMCSALERAVRNAGGSARALVLASAGPDFCVGADLVERHSLLGTGMDEARAASTALTDAVLTSPVPVIAAVSGYALGGGLELALAADLIVADRTTVLGLPEVQVGIVPGGGGTQLLARRVGWGRAVDLMLTGRRVDADEALRIGLADRVDDHDDAQGAALRLAGELGTGSATALRLARAAMRDGWGPPLADGLALEDAAWREAAAGDDYRAALERFAAKKSRTR